MSKPIDPKMLRAAVVMLNSVVHKVGCYVDGDGPAIGAEDVINALHAEWLRITADADRASIGWRDAKHDVPPLGVDVIVTDGRDTWLAPRVAICGREAWLVDNPTHWMPIPPLPEAK